MRAKLRAAGTALFLGAALCAALIATDPPPPTLASARAAAALAPASYVPAASHVARIHPDMVETIIPPGRAQISVPIMMYHYIRDVPKTPDVLGYNLSTSPTTFAAEMDWLAAKRYHPITMEDLAAYFTANQPLPSEPVVLTFDDGYLDLYTAAFPILEAHHFKAVAYIVSGFVGTPRYVSAAMVKEMDSNGIEIASHTVDHPNLTHASVAQIAYEVTASKQWLERLLGHPVVDFAYPSGRYNATVIQELARAGYTTAVTEVAGTDHTWPTRFVWARVRAYGGETLQSFITNLGRIEPSVPVTREAD